ncbi:MAG: RNA polymerase sigma factor [Phycisphaerae bacterium]
MKAPTDEQLLQEFLAGKASSFELLVRRYTQELYQFVFRFTGTSVAAEDVVQETLLQVHHSAAQFDASRRLKPWVFTIAANKARDHLRRQSRRREVPFDAPVGGSEESGQRFIDLLGSEESPPEEELELDERRRLVRTVMATMPEQLREVLILAYYHRFPYKEIASVVGIPLGTVKSRLHAAVLYFGRRYREAASASVRERP